MVQRLLCIYINYQGNSHSSIKGNHPGLVIFDEPAQHSIVLKDLVALFSCIKTISGDYQTILAITMNSKEINEVLNEFKNEHNIIHLDELAFKKLSNE